METSTTDGAAAGAADPLTLIEAAVAETADLAKSAFALLGAEIRLARSSAIALFWLALALTVFGVGAWLAVGAAIAAGVFELTGSVFLGVAAVALINLAGIALTLRAMRTCWRDLALPRTRRALTTLGDGSC